MSKLKKLVADKHLAITQKWIYENVQYETYMGSVSYGVSNDTSDVDIYGWTIPPKAYTFPHTTGHIAGLGPPPPKFETFQQHHIKVNDKEYDFQIFSLVKYADLVAGNNPNVIDSLFTPENCVVSSTPLGDIFRSKRREFLHKGSWHTFKGYAYSQLHKMKNKKFNEDWTTKRKDSIEKHGFDVKNAYHVVRLMNEAEQILAYGDIDLQQNREQLKAIRRGDVSFEEIESLFHSKEKELEALYLSSKIPHSPDWQFVQQTVYDILETFYGNLGNVQRLDSGRMILNDLETLLKKYS